VPKVAHYLRSMREVLGSRVFHGAEAQRCLQLLERAERPVLVAHRSPDGDAVGSTLGLWHACVSRGISAHVVLPDGFPDFYDWMPAVQGIVFHDAQADHAEALVRGADLVFCCDFNALNRVGGLEVALRQTEGPRVLLDHHLHPEDAFDLAFSDTSVCSTSELVYGLLEAWGWTDGLSRAAAECLYVGMVTDSGSFRFPAVTPSTHRIAARLLEAGVEQAAVHARVYDTNSLHRMRLLGFSLSEKLRVFPEFHAAYIALSRAELDRFEARSGDTEGLVNEALRIAGINLAAFFSEAPDGRIKLSLRSRGAFSVREVAAEHFNGGGHFNASGGAVEGSTLHEVCARFEALLPGYAAALNYTV
jgi:phosphoesterase RecJ-like protein